MPSALGASLGFLARLERIENLLGCRGCKILLHGQRFVFNASAKRQKWHTHVEVIVHDHHWRIATRPLAFDLDDCELAVLRCVARFDAAQVLADGVKDVVRAAQHARCCRAHLDKVLADGLAAFSARHV